MKNYNLSLYAVTLDILDYELQVKLCTEALQAGIDVLQFRIKSNDYESKKVIALKLKELCFRYHTLFIINDDYQLAYDIKHYYVHLGQDDFNDELLVRLKDDGFMLGVSINGIDQLTNLTNIDYIGVGAVASTNSKDNAIVLSEDELTMIIEKSIYPIVVIGGLNENNISNYQHPKIKGYAMINAIFNGNIISNISHLRSIIDYTINNSLVNVLTIAGSDCSGGAGIQADLKTFSVLNAYGMSVISALTAQNTTGVTLVEEVSSTMIDAQIKAIFNDFKVDSIKIGMVKNENIIKIIAANLISNNIKKIIIDPVMVSTSNHDLSDNDYLLSFKKYFYPLAYLITPNMYEASQLSGIKITSKDDMIKAAKIIALEYPGAILIKGGHLQDEASDLLYFNDDVTWFYHDRIDNDNIHGSGCTLSSAIAVYIAQDYDLETSILKAKNYLNLIINAKLDKGHGQGPLYHNVNILNNR